MAIAVLTTRSTSLMVDNWSKFTGADFIKRQIYFLIDFLEVKEPKKFCCDYTWKGQEHARLSQGMCIIAEYNLFNWTSVSKSSIVKVIRLPSICIIYQWNQDKTLREDCRAQIHFVYKRYWLKLKSGRPCLIQLSQIKKARPTNIANFGERFILRVRSSKGYAGLLPPAKCRRILGYSQKMEF